MRAAIAVDAAVAVFAAFAVAAAIAVAAAVALAAHCPTEVVKTVLGPGAVKMILVHPVVELAPSR